MHKIILDEEDASTLLRILYNGRIPTRVHTLICLCGATADLRKSPKAWNGWQVLPNAKCPVCLRAPAEDSTELTEYLIQARDRFQLKLGSLPGHKE